MLLLLNFNKLSLFEIFPLLKVSKMLHTKNNFLYFFHLVKFLLPQLIIIYCYWPLATSPFTIDYYPPLIQLFTIIHYYLSLLISTYHHLLLLTTTYHHLPLLIILHHLLSSLTIFHHHYPLSPIVIDRHSSLLIIIQPNNQIYIYI